MYLDITTANWTLANNYRASNFAKTATSAKQNKPLFVFLSMLWSKYAIKMGLLLIFFTENSAAQAHSCTICVVLLTEKLVIILHHARHGKRELTSEEDKSFWALLELHLMPKMRV